jgi:glutathione peroxidase-family protein
MSVHEFTVQTASGEERPLSEYAGTVLLIVNTATKCGLATRFEGLQHFTTIMPSIQSRITLAKHRQTSNLQQA